jgi:hypothetical protein
MKRQAQASLASRRRVYHVMRPLEITDYKNKWLPGHCVRIHSDLRGAARDWCKQLDRHTWHHKKWTDVYEDTFLFEDQRISQVFAEEFIPWTKMT